MMILNSKWLLKDVKESGRGLFKVLYWRWHSGTKGNDEKPVRVAGIFTDI